MYYKINMYIFLIAIFLDYIDSSKFIKTSAHVVCSVVFDSIFYKNIDSIFYKNIVKLVIKSDLSYK